MNDRLAGAIVCALLLAPAAADARAATLEPAEAVRRALAQNPSLAASLASRESASWAIEFEDALFTPTLQLDAGLDHSEVPRVGQTGTELTGVDRLSLAATLSHRLRLGTDLSLRVEQNERWEEESGLLAVGAVYDTSARLELTQPVLRGAGRSVTEAALEAARAQEVEAVSAAERSASELVRDVLVAWWELWYADESLRIERESLELSRRQLAEAERRVELGAQAPVELLTFQTQVAERQESVAAAEATRRERAFALAALLGETGGQPRTTTPDLEPVAAPPVERARELAAASSPAVREAKAMLATAQVQSETAADAYRARLDLQGYAEAGSVSTAFVGANGPGEDSTIAWTAGVNLIFELPLSGRRRDAAAQQARLAVTAAERRLEQARIEAVSTVDTELARIESAATRLGLAEQTVEVAERQLAAARRRYEIGTGTPLDVLEAEDAVRAARLRLARAVVDLRNADARVNHLTGALLSRWVPDELLAAQGS